MQYATPISKIMTRKPATIKPNDTLDAVRLIFESHGFHHIPVVEERKLVGIVSYTDYLRTIRELYAQTNTPQNNSRLLATVAVKDMMTTEIVCLAPFDTVEDALRVFKTHQFHAVPVVEGERHLVGILSTFDLIKMLEQVLAPELDYYTV